MKKGLSVRFLYNVIFTSLLVLTCVSYAVAMKVSITSGREQAKVSHAEVLSLYMENVDKLFSGADNFLVNYISNSDPLLELVYPDSELSRVLAWTSIRRDLSNGVVLHNDIDSFFFYDAMDDMYIQTLSANVSGMNHDMKYYVVHLVENDSFNNQRWNIVLIEGQYYMIRMEEFSGMYVGCWIRMDSVVSSLRETYQKLGGDAVIYDREGNPLTKSGWIQSDFVLDAEKYADIEFEDGKSYLRILHNSTRIGVTVAAYISDAVIYENVLKTSLILTVVFLVILALIIVSMAALRRMLFSPLFELYDQMEKVKDGDLAVRMREDVWQHEYHQVYHTFNGMMDEVGRLKLDVYEQQIKYQQMWLQYLQVQIQPHFFLNTLNLIYSMSRLGQNDMIQKLSLHLVAYFRYLFREPLSHVTLESELCHVKNYLEIQKMRFPDKFEYKIEIGEDEKNAIIPPLIIQTYVENCIKHVDYASKKGSIQVIVERRGTNVEITISDNGKGFSVKMLKLLNDETKTISKDKIYNVGIDNARLRLKIFFENNYYNMFYNSQGAVVKLVIPYMEARENVPTDID